MNGTIIQGKRIAFVCFYAEAAGRATTLLIRHTNRTVVNGIGIAIRRIKQIEHLFGKIQPVVFIKICSMIFPDGNLEISLPLANGFMIRLCSRCKVIGLVYALLMKVYMHVGHPLQVLYNTLLAFYLCLPGPVTVKIKVVMVASAAGPGFPVFSGIDRWIVIVTHHTIEPVYIPVSAVRIQARIHDNHGVF